MIVAVAMACACTVIAFAAKWQKLQSANEPVADSAAEQSDKTVEADGSV